MTAWAGPPEQSLRKVQVGEILHDYISRTGGWSYALGYNRMLRKPHHEGAVSRVPSMLVRRPSVAIETHGCKLNQADTATLAARFRSAGFDLVPTDQPADVYLVNSCTVTHTADRKARHSLRLARRRNPEATIVATGCYAERDPAALNRLNEVDLVAGNGDKVRLVADVLALRGQEASTCGAGSDEIPLSPRTLRTRAFVKIQEGCDQVCAYCIVPRVRGRERSIPAATIVSQIRRLEDVGYREVVLTGTQLGTYGFDLRPQEGPSTLTSLLNEILERTGIDRIRVSSLQPQEIDDSLIRLWSNDRLCPHFHLPLQSGSDSVLKRMRRRYTAAQYARAVEIINEGVSQAGLTADVIAGFPGETSADHAETCRLIDAGGFSGLHVFRFSRRPGTTAFHLKDDVPAGEKSERADELIGLGDRAAANFREGLLGTARPVLWEERRNGAWTGLTDNYVRVLAHSNQDLFNRIGIATLLARAGKLVSAKVDSAVSPLT